MRKFLLAGALAATLAPIASVAADPPGWSHGRGARHERDRRHYRTTENGVRYWRGDDGRYYCRRSNGTTGLLVGAALGALMGRAVDTHGERATGTILGAAGGALLGREVERGRTRCR